jgi:predicted RNA binding protein YcfA (HicA-like mRNA interferase family)
MKRHTLLRHLRKNGCYLKREGSAHSLWINPLNGVTEAIPRHSEISDKLVRKICKHLNVSHIKG